MTRPWTRATALAAVVGGLLLASAAPAAAHPLGSFSVNTYSAVVVEPQAVRVDVVVDRAEIPTQQDFPALDARTGRMADADAVAADLCSGVVAAARLRADGSPVPLDLVRSALTFPEGTAGLRTSRLVCALRSPDVDTVAAGELSYALGEVSPAAGWRETTATGDGVRVRADVPAESVTDALVAYPEDRLASPLDVPGATLSVSAGSGVVTGTGGLTGSDEPVRRGADRLTAAFTGLVAQQELSVPFGLLAVGVALGLGALHAFAPGHGKTVMAAVLVGRRGSLRDAALLGTSVTVTHTAGVLLLGGVLSVVGLAAPDRLYPVLGTGSGLLLVGVGLVLLRSARQRRAAAAPAEVPVLAGVAAAPHGREHPHDHDHPHHHDHDHHHDHAHDHAHDPAVPHSHGLLTHTHALPRPGDGWRSLLVVGLAGGLVPSPSAVVVLLGGVALGRAWFGTLLVLAYGVGMAAALMGTALLLVRARGRVQRLAARPRLRGLARAATVLPVATAALVVVGGLVVTARSVAQL